MFFGERLQPASESVFPPLKAERVLASYLLFHFKLELPGYAIEQQMKCGNKILPVSKKT